jgi:DNA polymerase-3 subunit alpha
MPDIDMDLPDDKRDDIIKYVRDFYGMDKVASICTYGTFLKKSAIRDTARIFNISGVLLNNILKESESYHSLFDMMQDSPQIKNIMNQSSDAKQMILIASKIEGLYRHVSTHAAGIIVSKEKLTRNTPVQNGLLDMFQTQYEAKDLESLGLLKIDFLGLKNLSIIDRVVQTINEKEKKRINIYNVPLNDQKTFDLLKRVDTTGVFQLESKGMRSLIRQMQIDSFEDIVTILALYRPGPMESIPSYLSRRFGEEEVSYPHPLLEPILKPTNGIIIYQEQIIQIAAKFAGYNLGEADILRRAVSKKQESVLEKEREHFIKKARLLKREDKVSNEIYDYIVKFANYGFNRAHSVAYAMVSYWMAYLKANYPKYFVGELTSSVIGSESQMKEYIFEAKKFGVAILKPSVNYSTSVFEPEKENLRYPLLGIKNVGRNSVRDLLHIRNNDGVFKTFPDFVKRVKDSLNKRVIESLIYAGALDEFGYSKKAMITQLDDVLNYSLYGGFIDEKKFVIRELDEYDFPTLQEKEKAVLGFNLFVNPINNYEDYIMKHSLLKPSDLTMKHVGKEFRIIAQLMHVKTIKTKNGDDMAFLTFGDDMMRIDSVLFTKQYELFQNDLSLYSVYLLKGKIEQRNDKLQLTINNMKKMEME